MAKTRALEYTHTLKLTFLLKGVKCMFIYAYWVISYENFWQKFIARNVRSLTIQHENLSMKKYTRFYNKIKNLVNWAQIKDFQKKHLIKGPYLTD